MALLPWWEYLLHLWYVETAELFLDDAVERRGLTAGMLSTLACRGLCRGLCTGCRCTTVMITTQAASDCATLLAPHMYIWALL
jgi:hypothetical protein